MKILDVLCLRLRGYKNAMNMSKSILLWNMFAIHMENDHNQTPSELC
jgi:hypothetical protein